MPHPAHLPCAGYRAGVPPHVAKTMRPRRTARLRRSAPLFRLERAKRRAPYLSRLSFRQAFRIFQSVPFFDCLALLNLFGRTF